MSSLNKGDRVQTVRPIARLLINRETGERLINIPVGAKGTLIYSDFELADVEFDQCWSSDGQGKQVLNLYATWVEQSN